MNHFQETIKPSVYTRIDNIQLESNLIPNTLNFCDIFAFRTTPAIIAEIKFASPSRGRIYPGNLDAVTIAGNYLSQGASAISILTEPHYFQGDIETIRAVRKAYPKAPILLKDFIFSEKQINQGLQYGANAVLLIVAFLEPKRLKTLYEYALGFGLTPLIEVHNLTELKIALELTPKIIGINHRHLDSLNIDLKSSEDLIKSIPKDILVIAESGIQTPTDLKLMTDRGVQGCLIGTQFMQHEDPGQALQALLGAHDAY